VAAAIAPAAANFQTTETIAVSRPSPFSDLHEADRQQVRSVTITQPTPPVRVAAATADTVRKPLKPFIPKPADRLSAQNSRDRALALPAPPPLATNVIPVPATALGHKPPCCVGTAYLEPAKPTGFHRVLRRVPGLRRIGQHPETEDGFVAPKPKRDITFMLPPEARATLRDGRMDLKASVDESGRVTRVELLAPKDEELVRLASYAASDWSFTPARVSEKTVPSEVIMHFNFGN
jgi:TonB family protein